jgi:hypothetical protein
MGSLVYSLLSCSGHHGRILQGGHGPPRNMEKRIGTLLSGPTLTNEEMIPSDGKCRRGNRWPSAASDLRSFDGCCPCALHGPAPLPPIRRLAWLDPLPVRPELSDVGNPLPRVDPSLDKLAHCRRTQVQLLQGNWKQVLDSGYRFTYLQFCYVSSRCGIWIFND